LLKDKNGRVYFGVSDLDLGVVTTRDGRVLTDREVRKYLVDHRTSSINAFLADELGMEEARVIDHGAHVNFMGGDVDAFGNKLSSQPNAGLDAKGAEWNYVVDAATSTVEKRWLPTFVERLPDAPSNSIVQEFLRNVKDYRGQYHPNLFRKKNG
jgi:hypothetical protein